MEPLGKKSRDGPILINQAENNNLIKDKQVEEIYYFSINQENK